MNIKEEELKSDVTAELKQHFITAQEAYNLYENNKRQRIIEKIFKTAKEGCTYCYIDLGTPTSIINELISNGYSVVRSGASTYLVNWTYTSKGDNNE